jgi:mRNA interferase MazF
VVARGEIWWYEPPDEKPRPYLILTRDQALSVLDRVHGVPTTSNVRGIPSEVRLSPDDGMTAECALSFDNLRLIRKSLLTRRITALPEYRWSEVCEVLNFTLAC